jgi:hypothetical protein
MRTYTIGGNSVTVQKNSLNICDRLNERTTCSFVVIEPTFEIARGMDVVVVQNGTIIFKGKVFKPKASGEITKYVTVSCVDYSVMADKRIIAEAYENELAGDIVRDFITKYFADEGITEGTIQDGPTISRAVFNYDNGNVAMNQLCEITGFFWGIDNDLQLNFFDRATYTAPFVLTDTSHNYGKLQAEENANLYRNRQYVRGPQAVSALQIRTFAGDGETQTFAVELPLASKPALKINGVAVAAGDIGIRGLDTGKKWYWQKNEKDISQESTETKLTSSDVLTVEFYGYYPLIIVADKPAEILGRQTLEGGSGLYEQVTEAPAIDTQDAALQFTNGLLEKYGAITQVITFNTYDHGLKAGHLIPIQNTMHGLNGTYLIESVTARADGDLTLYSVKCLDGSSIGGWERFYKSLIQAGKKFTIRDNEILVKLITFRDDFITPVMEDEMTYTIHQYLICSLTTICGAGVII